MIGVKTNLYYSTPYELHKKLINHYVLNRKGATALLQRDTSRDKRDIDVIRENHKFVWEEEEKPFSWEEKLAKKYYDKLFKEYCISDLSRYKENKFAMRWQTEAEMITGKGQFVCGAKCCILKEQLRTWEVNFAYVEHGQKKNTLVKLRLCQKCSDKLNYNHKRKEVKREKRKGKSKPSSSFEKIDHIPSDISAEDLKGDIKIETDTTGSSNDETGDNLWKAPLEEENDLSREDEFEKYLEELLL